MLAYVLQQQVERHGGEKEEDRIRQVGDDGNAHKSGVGHHVPGRRRRVARDVQGGIYKALGKASRNAHYQVEHTRDPCQALG
jgi:hypothetical protein